MSGRYINHVLAELGWLVPGVKGWRLTKRGSELGGSQIEDEETSIPYVKWPVLLMENVQLKQALALSYGSLSHDKSADLFGDDAIAQSIDGHDCDSPELAALCNWLYFAGINHSRNRQLPIDGNHQADYYLPDGNVYIEFWGSSGSPQDLSTKLKRKELYAQHGLSLIELESKDISKLDEVMPRELLKHNLTVY